MKSRVRDPLAPIENVVSFLLLALVVVLLTFVALAGFNLIRSGDAGGLSGIGDDTVCVADVANVPTFVDGGARRPNQGIRGLDRENTREFSDVWRVCLYEPTGIQRAAASASHILTFLGLLGALILVRRAVRGARASGLFTTVAARRTRALGWFMLTTAVLLPLISSATTTWVMYGVVDASEWSWSLYGPGILFTAPFSALAIVVSIGIITFARILERAVPLQEEVDATV